MFSSFPLLLISPGCFSKILLGVTACLGVFAELKAVWKKGCQSLWTEREAKREPSKMRSQPWRPRHMAPVLGVRGGVEHRARDMSQRLPHVSQGRAQPPPSPGKPLCFLWRTDAVPLCSRPQKCQPLSQSVFILLAPGAAEQWWEESEH